MIYERKIFAEHLLEVTSRIKDFERRLKSPIDIKVSDSFYEPMTTDNGYGFFEFVNLTVDIPEIDCVKPGYKVVAYVQYVKDLDSGIIHVFDEKFQEAAEKLRDPKASHCDHCNINRRRNALALVYNEEKDDLLVVGSTCLKDYLKINKNPYRLFEVSQKFFVEKDPFADLDRGHKHYSISDILGYAAWLIDTKGYISINKAKQIYGSETFSTSFETKMFFWNTYDTSKVTDEAEDDCPQKFYDLGNEILAWIRNNHKTELGTNSYDENVRIFIQKDRIDERFIGFLPFISCLYFKKLNLLKEKEKENKTASEHVGTIGQREIFKLKVVDVKIFDGNFGSTVRYVFEDENGNKIIWFSSNFFDNVKEGEWYNLTGRVKDHKEYRGEKQTILTRCKFELQV